MSYEPALANQWLYETLNAVPDLAGNVHDTNAPQGVALPYVVFNLQAGTDVPTANGTRIMANLLYQVAVVGTSAFSALASLASAVDAALQRASGSVVGGAIFSCVRESTLQDAETDSGVTYRYLRLFFRLYAQGVS